MHSAICQGRMQHRRFHPKQHHFSYKLNMSYLDLDELDQLLSMSPLWGKKWYHPARFKRDDYHRPEIRNLKEAVKKTVFEKSGIVLDGPIRVLTHLRQLGILFNPVSFYFCFEKDGHKLQCIMAEITNTPWLERHSYVLDCRKLDQKKPLIFDFNKAFHISPFNDMKQAYHWVFNVPDGKLRVYMQNFENGKAIFDASMALEMREASASALNWKILLYPLETIKVIWGIYWQAMRLKLKGVPFYTHPEKKGVNDEQFEGFKSAQNKPEVK